MDLTLSELLDLPRDFFYVTLNGKIVEDWSTLKDTDNFRTNIRVLGGKGGFGSLLRSFGSQFYKSTNQDMCRDLSGRRLKDVKQEEKLKKYISKAAQREQEKQKKLDEKYKRLKQLDERKHEFNDVEYSREKERILEETDAALQEGLKALEEESAASAAVATTDEAGSSGFSSKVTGKRKRDSDDSSSSSSSSSTERKEEKPEKPVAKKPKGGLWLGIEGLNESDLDSDEDESEEQSVSVEIQVKKSMKAKISG